MYPGADVTASQMHRSVCRELCYLSYKNVQRIITQGGKLNYTNLFPEKYGGNIPPSVL